MKKFRKMIPMAALTFAVAGAFASQAMNKTLKLTSIQGYVKLNATGTVCERSIWCSDAPGPLCMLGTTQIWDKDASGRCIVQLYRDTR